MYLISALEGNEKLLFHFYSAVCGEAENIRTYTGRWTILLSVIWERGSYWLLSCGKFHVWTERFLNEDVERMVDNGHYMSAFELMNHIFVRIGDVEMDDSDAEQECWQMRFMSCGIDCSSRSVRLKSRRSFSGLCHIWTVLSAITWKNT